MEEPKHSDMLPPCGGEADSDPEGMGDGKHCTLLLGSTHPPRHQSSKSVKKENMENGADKKTSHIPEASQRSEEEGPEAKKVKLDTVMVCEDDEGTCLSCGELCEEPVTVDCGHCLCRSCVVKARENLDSLWCPKCKKVVTEKNSATDLILADMQKMAAALTKRPKKAWALPFVKCKEHDEALKLYCTDDGDLGCVICRDALKHNGHKFLSIKDAVEVYEAEVLSVMSPLEEAWKKTSEMTIQQREKIKELRNTKAEYRQHILSEFRSLYVFLKKRKEKLLEQLQEQNKSLLEEMEPNAAKMKMCRDSAIEAMALCKMRMCESNSFSFLDGIQDLLEKCREQQKLLADIRVTENELCRATFNGPLQYIAWKQMKSIVQGTKEIWIGGNGYIDAIHRRIEKNLLGLNLGSQSQTCKLSWLCMNERCSTFVSEISKYKGKPDVVFFHFGSNGLEPVDFFFLCDVVSEALINAASLFPNTEFILSTLYPETEGNAKGSNANGRSRFFKMLNITAMRYGWVLITHDELEEMMKERCSQSQAQTNSDDISDAEAELFIERIQDSLMKALSKKSKPANQRIEASAQPSTGNMEPVKKPMEIWIIGDSDISGVASHAQKRASQNLGLDVRRWAVRWMPNTARWKDLLLNMHNANRTLGIPSIVYLHIGGNDLSELSHGTMVNDFIFDFGRLMKLFPNTQFIYSSILPREEWTWDRLGDTRKRFNKKIDKLATRRGVIVVDHGKLEEALSLRFEGGETSNTLVTSENDLFLTDIRTVIETAVQKVAVDPSLAESGAMASSSSCSDGGCPAEADGSVAVSGTASSGPPFSMAAAPGNHPGSVSLIQEGTDIPAHLKDSPCVVMIIGNSYIVGAAQRAAMRSGTQLGLPEGRARLNWAGVSDLQWCDLRAHTMETAKKLGAPGVLVLHAGGDDLGKVPTTALLTSIKRDLLFFLDKFPGVVLVWSEIIPRFECQHGSDLAAIKKARIKINRNVANFVQLVGGLAARHELVEGKREFFCDDGIHLNEVGTDLFNSLVQETIAKAVECWWAGQLSGINAAQQEQGQAGPIGGLGGSDEGEAA